MKNLTIVLALACQTFALPAASSAAVPGLLSYQGKLSDSGGSPIDQTVSMTFRIYDVASGGVPLWNETQSVQVSNGVFGVQLGQSTPLPPSIFNQDILYLGIQVGADSEMVPRQALASSAYAQRSELVSFPVVPVGGIFAWAKSVPGVPALPIGWVECNGQVLSDPESPLNGQVIPDLNGVGGTPRFLRGAAASGATGGSETHSHPLDRQIWVGSGGNNWWHNSNQWIGQSSSLPSYYSVVWIMKVRDR